jgi:hypothetical protein
MLHDWSNGFFVFNFCTPAVPRLVERGNKANTARSTLETPFPQPIGKN